MLKNTILAQNATPQPSFYILTKAEFRKSTKIKIDKDNSPFIPIKLSSDQKIWYRVKISAVSDADGQSIEIPLLVWHFLRLSNPLFGNILFRVLSYPNYNL